MQLYDFQFNSVYLHRLLISNSSTKGNLKKLNHNFLEIN